MASTQEFYLPNVSGCVKKSSRKQDTFGLETEKKPPPLQRRQKRRMTRNARLHGMTSQSLRDQVSSASVCRCAEENIERDGLGFKSHVRQRPWWACRLLRCSIAVSNKKITYDQPCSSDKLALTVHMLLIHMQFSQSEIL